MYVPSGVSTLSSEPFARIVLCFSKLKSISLLSSMGRIGALPFNLFLHPDLALSVAAPFSAAQVKHRTKSNQISNRSFANYNKKFKRVEALVGMNFRFQIIVKKSGVFKLEQILDTTLFGYTFTNCKHHCLQIIDINVHNLLIHISSFYVVSMNDVRINLV